MHADSVESIGAQLSLSFWEEWFYNHLAPWDGVESHGLVCDDSMACYCMGQEL